MLRTERTRFHGDHHPVQMASLPSREYFPLCPLLASECAQLPRCGGADARTMCAWGAHHDLALDAIRHSRTGAMLFYAAIRVSGHIPFPGSFVQRRHRRWRTRHVRGSRSCRLVPTREQLSAQHSPDNARLEQRSQGFEQVPHLKESCCHEWMRRGQTNHAADVPGKKTCAQRSVPFRFRIAQVFSC
jgi:hypothetical protein